MDVLSAPPAVPLPTAADFTWLHPPPAWDGGAEAGLRFTTAPDTDFWQRTHYGFRRDNGHVWGAAVSGDASLTARVTAEPNSQYDQLGLVARVDAETWAKCSVEYETPAHSRLGSVVTRGGYSDWATQDVGALPTAWYRLDVRGDDLRMSWSLDGGVWHQLRIAHLPRSGPIVLGVYGCSPTGPGFRCRADEISLGPTDWPRG